MIYLKEYRTFNRILRVSRNFSGFKIFNKTFFNSIRSNGLFFENDKKEILAIIVDKGLIMVYINKNLLNINDVSLRIIDEEDYWLMYISDKQEAKYTFKYKTYWLDENEELLDDVDIGVWLSNLQNSKTKREVFIKNHNGKINLFGR